jgi:hypothetical protein
VLVAVPVAIEAWTALRPRIGRWSARELLGGLAAVAAPVAGLALGILWIGATTGDLGEPLRIQRQLRAGFRDPVTRLAESMWDVARLDLRDVYNVAFAVLFIVLLVLSWRRRQPWSWLAYSAVTLVVGLSANNIDSLGRYGLLALPLVVALAQWAAPRWRQALVAGVGSAGLVWMTAAALLGRMIP